MRLNPKYVLRQVAGETLLISLQDITAPKRVLCLNELGRDVFSLIRQGYTPDELVSELLPQYEVDEPVLRGDIESFLAELTKYEVFLPDETKKEAEA